MKTLLSTVISEAVSEAIQDMQEAGVGGISTQLLNKYVDDPDATSNVSATYTPEDKKNPDVFNDEDEIFKVTAEISNLILSKGGKLFGEGSSRKTFLLTSKKILKLAKSDRGIAQNEAEVQVAKKFPTITTKIYYAHPNNFYLISELVRQLSSKPNKAQAQFKDLTGLSLYTFFRLLKTYSDWNESETGDLKLTPTKFVKQLNQSFSRDKEELEKLSMSPFVRNILSAIDYGLHVEDLTTPEHWGVTTEGKIVLLDYGYTQEVSDNYY